MITFAVLSLAPYQTEAAYHFNDFKGVAPIHTYGTVQSSPRGMTPAMIKNLYHLPQSGGTGTIAIIGAYDSPTIAADLKAFSTQFNLPACMVQNGCLEVHPMQPKMSTNFHWNLEAALDVEWAHAIAPGAKILLVEAATPSGQNFLDAIDYAGSRTGIRAISMSWGGQEFPEETSLDAHFATKNGAIFFASSGDSGTGASWPASSPSVIAVGGTTLARDAKGAFISETAWKGSGGGTSAYEKEPAYQQTFSIPRAKGMRAIPDVAYDADPATGFPVVYKGLWRLVGGTSAGAPQWAAIATLGSGIAQARLYKDKQATDSKSYFRDITSGTNGSCSYYCDARAHYDYVTGLGTPQTAAF